MTHASYLPYSTQWISREDIRAVVGALSHDWITQGPQVDLFEQAFAAYSGAAHAVAFSSGTAALHGACAASGLGPGKEAIVPPVTFVATANAVVYTGAVPRFADVDPETATMDPSALERAVTSRTRAVLPVDYAGHPCDYDALRRIARKKGLVVIEDAAHALGARYRGRRVGSLADMTIFSFHPVKHITTGEGGMVTTDDPGYARYLRAFRQHGITKDPAEMSRHEGAWYYEMQDLGFNYRITDFQCALGASQLRRIQPIIERRRTIAQQYNAALADVDELQLPPERPWARHSYHLYPVRLRTELLRISRREVFDQLRDRGIGVQVMYIPVYWQPYYSRRFKFRRGLCPNAEKFYESEISLPIFPQLRSRDAGRVVRALKDILARGRKREPCKTSSSCL